MLSSDCCCQQGSLFATTAADEATVHSQYGSGIQADAFKWIIGYPEKEACLN